MTQEEFVLLLASYLESTGIPYMVVGSYSSGQYGMPRTTHDVDFVIDPTTEQLTDFLSLLGEQYYVSKEAAHEALRLRSMFNVINFDEGRKADFIVRKNRPFSVEEFRRRRLTRMLGGTLPLASAEDVILSKLEWNKITPSERQLQDALQVVVVQATSLDLTYLRQWAPMLGVEKELELLFEKVAEAQNPPAIPDEKPG